MTYGYPNWDTYQRTVGTLKWKREMAAGEWDRFKNGPDSQTKLKVLRDYINAILAYVSDPPRNLLQTDEPIITNLLLCSERAWRANDWDPEWGTQDDNHRRWIERLDDTRRGLESQEALLQHRLDNCGPGTSNSTGGGHGELRDCPNICGNPSCGISFICAADYNRIVIPQGYRGV